MSPPPGCEQRSCPGTRRCEPAARTVNMSHAESPAGRHLQLLVVHHAQRPYEVIFAHIARVRQVLAHHHILNQRLRCVIVASLLHVTPGSTCKQAVTNLHQSMQLAARQPVSKRAWPTLTCPAFGALQTAVPRTHTSVHKMNRCWKREEATTQRLLRPWLHLKSAQEPCPPLMSTRAPRRHAHTRCPHVCKPFDIEDALSKPRQKGRHL